MPYAVIILLEISEVDKHKPELCMQLHINVYSSDKNRAFLKVTNNITTPTCYPGTMSGELQRVCLVLVLYRAFLLGHVNFRFYGRCGRADLACLVVGEQWYFFYPSLQYGPPFCPAQTVTADLPGEEN